MYEIQLGFYLYARKPYDRLDRLFDKFGAHLDRLFSLPMEDKMRAARERSSDRVSGYGCIPIACHFSKQMWSEGFTIVGSPLEHAERLWPHDPHLFWRRNYVHMQKPHLLTFISKVKLKIHIAASSTGYSDIYHVRLPLL